MKTTTTRFGVLRRRRQGPRGRAGPAATGPLPRNAGVRATSPSEKYKAYTARAGARLERTTMSGRVLRIVLPIAAVVFALLDGRPVAARLGPKSALVTVVAEAGTPIRDLKAKDFIVKEDGA